jgi:hypothetical protein
MVAQLVKQKGFINQQQEHANVLHFYHRMVIGLELKDIIIQIKHAKVIIFLSILYSDRKFS